MNDYKGRFISEIPDEEAGYFCNEDGIEIEEAILILAAIKKVPDKINDQWIIFSYQVGDNEHKDYLSGCGVRLPIAKEMESFINTIANGAFVEDDKWIIDLHGALSLENNIDNYVRFLEAHGLSWNNKMHRFQQTAYPIDATAKNIKILSGLSINPQEIDRKNECDLGLYIIG